MPEIISPQTAYRRRKFPEGETVWKDITVGGTTHHVPVSLFRGNESDWRSVLKFLEKWKQNPTIENYVTLLNKENLTTQKIIKKIRNYYTGSTAHTGPDVVLKSHTRKILDALKIDKTVLNEAQLKEFKRYTRNVTQGARAILQASPVSAKINLGKSAELIKRINKIFKITPDITLNSLAAKLNKKAWTAAGDVGKLDMATKTSHGVAKYLEALKDARAIKNWVPPTGKNKDRIIKNIVEGTDRGFRFHGETLRSYKFAIRDAALKLAPHASVNLRNKLRGLGMVIDEAAGLSATHANAPGYTELTQLLTDKVNYDKGIQLDRDFTKLVKKARAGDFSGAQGFNELSEKLGKKWNIDTPKLRPGGDPAKLVKYFEFMSPEAQKNVLELSKGPKGFAIESAALPWGEMGKRIKELKHTSEFKKFLETVVKTPAACRKILNYQVGGAAQSCAVAIRTDPVGTAEKISKLKTTGGALGKVKNAATTFLSVLGRGGVKVAPYAALAAVGAAIEPLVKQFRSDDPTTYLSDENQQKGMLLSMIEGETPKVDEDILKWQYPGMAASAAAAIPGSSAMMKARRAKGFGTPRAALGPVGKFLAGSFSPLGVAATLPLHIAAQRKGGTDWGDIATDPMNWMAPAFASSGAKMATRGMAPTGILAKAIRMGMSPRALMLGSRFLGWPGLALTAGMWGYDKWKNRDRDD